MAAEETPKKKSGIYARQGDIGLLYFSGGFFPDEHEEILPTGGLFDLASGAATANRHQVAAADCRMFQPKVRVRGNADVILHVEKDTPMLHPEHENKIIEKGTYIVRRQRDGAAYVAD